jgi:predicted DNA binding protein
MSFYADIMEMLYTDLYCFFEYPIVYKENEIEFQVVGQRKNIKRFVDILLGLGIKVEISNVRKYHIKGRAIVSELTEKQYYCMRLAESNGYFDIPRRADLRKLSKKMKISHGAFSFHIRKAQRTINRALFG